MRTAVTVLAAVLFLCGCASNPVNVSDSELEEMEAAASRLTPGMSKEAVLDAFSSGQASRTGSTLVGEVDVQEWKVEGYTEPERRSEGLSFVGWYYFANDVLVDMSDERLNYRENAVLLEEWKSRGAGTPVEKPGEAE